MSKRIGFYGWIAAGMVAGAVVGILFDASPNQLAIWMISGLSGGMMLGFLFGPSRDEQTD